MPTLFRVRTLLTGTSVVGGGINTLYFEANTGNAQSVRSLVDLFWDAIMVQTSNTVTWTGDDTVDIVDEASGLTVGQEAVVSLSANGDVAGDVLPPANQGLIRLPTGIYVAGRQLRGRVYVPGVPEANSTNGAPTVAYQSALGTPATTLRADSTTVGNPWVVYSRTRLVAEPVTAPSVWNKFAMLRSRRD